jgi:hypothetical protein
VDTTPNASEGEQLAHQLRTQLERLGLAAMSVNYDAERRILRVSWPHQDRAGGEEGVEVEATPEGSDRALELFRAFKGVRDSDSGLPA